MIAWVNAKAEELEHIDGIHTVETLNGEIKLLEFFLPGFGKLRIEKSDWGMKVLKIKQPTRWVLEGQFCENPSDIVAASEVLEVRKEFGTELDAEKMKDTLEAKGFKTTITKVE